MSETEIHGGLLDAKVEQTGFRIVGNPAPLFEALAKAQGAFKPVLRSRENPFYKSKYAELSDIIAATKDALSANGLAVFQPPCRPGDDWEIRTILSHASGSFIETIARVPHVGDWQKVGAAQTYCRRYCHGAIIGVASEDDDDGNLAADAKPREQPRTAPTPPKVERPKPAQQSAPPKPAEPKPPAEERTAPLPPAQAQVDAQNGPAQNAAMMDQMAQQSAAMMAQVAQQSGNGAVSEPPPENPPSAPPDAAKPSKESMGKMRGLIQELGMQKMVPEWCEKILGVKPAAITLEAQVQTLIADLEQRKAATG